MKLSKILKRYEDMDDFVWGEITAKDNDMVRGYFNMKDGTTSYRKWQFLDIDKKPDSSIKADRFGVDDYHYHLKSNKKMVVVFK